MNIIIVSVLIVFFSSIGYCGHVPPNAVSKKEIIQRATEWAKDYNPPLDASRDYKVRAMYFPDENVWVVDFVDQSSTPLPDYMVRIEATSGKDPEVLTGSQITRYQDDFANSGQGE